jgi:hypothetical protein
VVIFCNLGAVFYIFNWFLWIHFSLLFCCIADDIGATWCGVHGQLLIGKSGALGSPDCLQMVRPAVLNFEMSLCSVSSLLGTTIQTRWVEVISAFVMHRGFWGSSLELAGFPNPVAREHLGIVSHLIAVFDAWWKKIVCWAEPLENPHKPYFISLPQPLSLFSGFVLASSFIICHSAFCWAKGQLVEKPKMLPGEGPYCQCHPRVIRGKWMV